jgi:predicted dehydrogenase
MVDPDRRTFIAQSVGALAAVALAPDLSFAVPRARSEPLRIALVGSGRHGRAILDELAKIAAVEVAAICDPVEARVRLGQERAAGAAAFAEHRALLDARPDIGAIVVATPTHLHRDIAIDALHAGRHVFCEAPLAATIDDCRAIADAAEAAAAAGTLFQAGLYARSNPIYKRAWSLVRSDSVRDIVALHAQHNRKTSWRFPAPDRALERATNWRLDPDVSIGLAGELGTHQFDALSWFRGRPPRRITGSGTIRLHDDGRTIPDTIMLTLEWDDDVLLHYQATLASSYGGQFEVIHGTHAGIRLIGTHGWLFKEADSATQGWEVYAARQRFPGEEGIVLVADATQLAAQGRLAEGAGLQHPPLYYALVDFINSVTDGAPVACTAQDALQATTIGILANEAVKGRTTIDVA